MIASRRKQKVLLQVATQLIQAPGVDLNLIDGVCQTALLLAVGQCNWPLIELLLQHGADPNILNVVNQTPLHWLAVQREHSNFRKQSLKAATQMIEAKVDVTLKDRMGETPLDCAK